MKSIPSLMMLYFFCCIAQFACAEEQPSINLPKRLDIKIEQVRWQTLDPKIRSAVVGPDKRIWYLLKEEQGVAPSVKLTKALIEREFSKPDPQLSGVMPVLFEPTGRVWFQNIKFEEPLLPSENHNVYTVFPLFGYDGKTWIEYNPSKAALKKLYAASEQFPFMKKLRHVHCNGRSFFQCDNEVHVFDGKEWSYVKLAEHAVRRFGLPGISGLLAVETDGNGVIAFADLSDVWRWRDNRWTQTKLPPHPPEQGILKIVPWDDRGCLVVFAGSNDYYYLEYEVSSKNEEEVVSDKKVDNQQLDSLLKELSATEFAARDKAIKSLRAMGPRILPHLKTTLEKETDPKVAERIRSIILSIEKAPAGKPQQLAKSHAPALDEIEFGRLNIISDNYAGNVFIASDKISLGEKIQSPGILWRKTDRSMKLLSGEEIYNHQPGLNLSPLVSNLLYIPDSQLLVSQASGTQGNTIVLSLDQSLKDNSLKIPYPGYQFIHSYSTDGLFIVGTKGFIENGDSIGIWQPLAKDNVTQLPTKEYPLSDYQYGMSSTGIIYAISDSKRQFVTIENGKSTPIEDIEIETRMANFIPGANGTMTIDLGRKAWFIEDGKVFSGSSLLNLILKQKERFIKAYKNQIGGDLTRLQRAQIIVDSQDRIWLVSAQLQNYFHVLIDEEWVDMSAKTSESAYKQYRPNFFLKVDGGKRFLINSISPSSVDQELCKKMSLFDYVNKTYEFSPLAPLDRREFLRNFIVLPDGKVWIASTENSPRKEAVNACSVLISPTEVIREVPNQIPILLDKSGNLWFRESDAGSTKYCIYRDEKQIGQISVPLSTLNDIAFSNKPGSVFFVTGMGLLHYAEEKLGNGKFKLNNTYSLTKNGIELPTHPSVSERSLFLITKKLLSAETPQPEENSPDQIGPNRSRFPRPAMMGRSTINLLEVELPKD